MDYILSYRHCLESSCGNVNSLVYVHRPQLICVYSLSSGTRVSKLDLMYAHINLLQLFKQLLHLARLISYLVFQFVELGTPYAISAAECKTGFLMEYIVQYLRMITILFFYFRFMKFRKPFELKKLIIGHNIIQVVSCVFVVHEVCGMCFGYKDHSERDRSKYY